MSEQIDYERRSFFGTAAMSIAAAQVGMMGSARAQTGNAKPKQLPTIKPGTNTSFGSLKQINSGPLSVGYADVGPADGAPDAAVRKKILADNPEQLYEYDQKVSTPDQPGQPCALPKLFGAASI
ncbi:MAG: hypothetical protein WAN75_31465, partial [Xanthobacteraceae bacterium]